MRGRHRSEVFWRMRASLGARKPLPCALRSPANTALGHEQGAPVLKHRLQGLGLCLSLHWKQPYLLFSVSLFFLLCACAWSSEVMVTSSSLPSPVSLRGLFSYKPTCSLFQRALTPNHKMLKYPTALQNDHKTLPCPPPPPLLSRASMSCKVSAPPQ